MTYGYYHVTLQSTQAGAPETDLIESAAEGLSSVAWSDAKTLIVQYDSAKSKDPAEDTAFVKKPAKWRDIKFEYRPISDPTGVNLGGR